MAITANFKVVSMLATEAIAIDRLRLFNRTRIKISAIQFAIAAIKGNTPATSWTPGERRSFAVTSRNPTDKTVAYRKGNNTSNAIATV